MKLGLFLIGTICAQVKSIAREKRIPEIIFNCFV